MLVARMATPKMDTKMAGLMSDQNCAVTQSKSSEPDETIHGTKLDQCNIVTYLNQDCTAAHFASASNRIVVHQVPTRCKCQAWGRKHSAVAGICAGDRGQAGDFAQGEHGTSNDNP